MNESLARVSQTGRVLMPRMIHVTVRMSDHELRYLDEMVRSGLFGKSRSAVAKELVMRGLRDGATSGFVHPITEPPEGQECYCLFHHGEWHGVWWCKDHNPGSSLTAQLKRVGPAQARIALTGTKADAGYPPPQIAAND